MQKLCKQKVAFVRARKRAEHVVTGCYRTLLATAVRANALRPQTTFANVNNAFGIRM